MSIDHLMATCTLYGQLGGVFWSALPEFIDQSTEVVKELPPEIGITLIVPGETPNELFVKHDLEI